jgi:hypothetical protein
MAAGMYSPLPFAAAQVCGAWSDAASNSLLQLLATQQQPVCRLLFKSSMHLNVLFASAVLLQQLQWCAMHLTYLLCLCQSLQVLVELPYVILQSLLYGTITYMLVHFELSAAKFWWYILFTFLTLLFFTYYGEGPRRYVAMPVFCRMAPPRGGGSQSPLLCVQATCCCCTATSHLLCVTRSWLLLVNVCALLLLKPRFLGPLA